MDAQLLTSFVGLVVKVSSDAESVTLETGE